MRRRKRREKLADLSRAATRFNQWRQRRARGARIPAALWQTALQLAGRHGLSRTATALKLDYYALKRRLAQRSSSAVAGDAPESRPTFVELPPASLANSAQCLIEFENAAGSTLRVYLNGGTIADLAALGRSFWDGP